MPRAAITQAVRLTRDGEGIRVSGALYSLEIPDIPAALLRAPAAVLSDADGVAWSRLSLLASAHTRGGSDDTLRVESIEAHERDGGVEIRVRAHSSVWRSRDLVLRCDPDGIAIRLELAGDAALTTLTLLGGRGAMPNSASGEFRSGIGFAGVMVPAATEPVQLVRPAHSAAALGVVGDADPGRLNAVFSPPPLALGLSRREPRGALEPPGGAWLGMWLRAPVEDLTFTAMRYAPLDGGFLVQLDYEGHTEVSGEWASPDLVIRPQAGGWAVLEAYRADLEAHGHAPAPRRSPERWWSEPIFCGWGAQSARAATSASGEPAPWYSRQEVYDALLARLTAHGVEPGTIVIDDRWQARYGSADVDVERWPDLRRWIADRHADGRRVLLWWKAWDAEGIPADECVRDAGGATVTVDAGSAAYRERLTAIIRQLLDPAGVGADGLKIDFTQRGPSGESLVGTPGVWGIAAVHRLLTTIADAAASVRPDALLVAHAIHPSFGDVCGMVRLNDVTERDVRGRPVPVAGQLAMRHAIASRVLPGHLIDTDQWPMPDRAGWLDYAAAQPSYGVPALYYAEAIDSSGEPILDADLERVAASWTAYREGL